MYKPYRDLTDNQKKLVSLMYADLSNAEAFEYNFDDSGFHGRRPIQKLPSPAPLVEEVKETVEKVVEKVTGKARASRRKKAEK